MSLWPTKKQWKEWSLPSKLTALGALFGLISIGAYVTKKVFQTATILLNSRADIHEFNGLMPFNTSWVFVGYYDSESELYLEGPFLDVVYRPGTNLRGALMPAVGDVLQVKKPRRVIITNYRTHGLLYQLTSPPLIHGHLLEKDETDVVLPKDELLIVRDVTKTRHSNRPIAIWSRVAECDSNTPNCAYATKLVLSQ